MTETYSGTASIPPGAVASIRVAMEAGKPIGLRTPDGAETQCLVVALDPNDEGGAVATLVGWGEEQAFANWTDDGHGGD